MDIIYLSLTATLVAVLVSSTSCSNLFNFDPSISDLTIATELLADSRPYDSTNSFFTDSPKICCSAKLSRAHPNTAVTADFVYVKGETAQETNPLIYEDKIICDNDRYIGFTLPAPAEGYISGEYRAEISIDGKQKVVGTFFIQKDSSTPLPRINSFAASPLSITAGQQTVLNWKVSNATRVNILPSPGSAGVEGTRSITPATDTTYTLWAVNRGGSSSNMLTVKVIPPITGRPDLVITEFWSSGNVISYRIKNIGNLASCPTESYLYKNDMQVSTDYVAPMEPGEERAEAFLGYHFSPRFPMEPSPYQPESGSDAANMRICLDGPNACAESSKDNNCMDHNYGPLLNINLVRYANSAQWQSSTNQLKWPMFRDGYDGWATVAPAQVENGGGYPDALIMVPPPIKNGWIQGTFGIANGSPVTVLPVIIPHKCKFSAKVGLTRDAPSTTSIKFTLGTAQGDEINFFPSVTVESKGKLENYEIDLSKLAGKHVKFIFKVESGQPLQQGNAVWIEPVLTQER